MIRTHAAPAGENRPGFVLNDEGTLDVIIVGGGPAGLSAALVLARSRRSTMVFDTGRPRNASSQGLHGYLTRDGILPGEFLALARREVASYGVRLCADEVTLAQKTDEGFTVRTATGQQYRARRILIATGVRDMIPEIEGMDECFGKSVFHCPYCDGWEVRDQPLAVLGKGRNGVELAVALKDWSGDVTLLTNGIKRLRSEDKALLDAHGVAVDTGRIARLEARDGQLERILFADGRALGRQALFISYGQVQHSDLVRQLGCAMTQKGVVQTDRQQHTNVTGVFVAGDAAKDMHMVIVAAAEGAKAAVTINKSFQHEQRKG